jgi:thioredoxin reductase
VNDVIVIGGGPAGSTVAFFIGIECHQVLILLKEKLTPDKLGVARHTF